MQTVYIAGEKDGPAADDFVAVYEEHYPRLVRALELGGMRRPDAEETAQEAFARTLVHWRRVRLGDSPAGYVYTTAFRLSRRLWRRDPERIAELSDVAATSGSRDVAGEVVTAVVVERVLADMPARRRACAVLCLVLGLSTKEAGRSLGIAEGTVRKQLAMARESLQSALEPD